MAMQGHRAIDLQNNRAAPVKGTPEGAPLLRSDPSAASCAPTGFARFDEKSKWLMNNLGSIILLLKLFTSNFIKKYSTRIVH